MPRCELSCAIGPAACSCLCRETGSQGPLLLTLSRYSTTLLTSPRICIGWPRLNIKIPIVRSTQTVSLWSPAPFPSLISIWNYHFELRGGPKAVIYLVVMPLQGQVIAHQSDCIAKTFDATCRVSSLVIYYKSSIAHLEPSIWKTEDPN
jgi:hypothetical protein